MSIDVSNVDLVIDGPPTIWTKPTAQPSEPVDGSCNISITDITGSNIEDLVNECLMSFIDEILENDGISVHTSDRFEKQGAFAIFGVFLDESENPTKYAYRYCIPFMWLRKQDNEKEMENDMNIACKASNLGLSPIIHKAIKAEFQGESQVSICNFYLTEHYENDMAYFFLSGDAHYKSLVPEVENQLLDLIIRMGQNDLFCIDLKPNNSVFRFNDSQIEVKLIDWDMEFCNNPSIGFSDTNTLVMLILYSLYADANRILRPECILDRPLFKDYLNIALKQEGALQSVMIVLTARVGTGGLGALDMALYYRDHYRGRKTPKSALVQKTNALNLIQDTFMKDTIPDTLFGKKVKRKILQI